MPPDLVRRFRSIRREDLEPADLQRYLEAAAGPEVGLSFRFYLPRILRLLARPGEHVGLHPCATEQTLERLSFARDAPGWTPAHETAVENVAASLITELI